MSKKEKEVKEEQLPKDEAEQETERTSFQFSSDGPKFYLDELTETQQFLYDKIIEVQNERNEHMQKIQQVTATENYLTTELKKALGVDDEPSEDQNV